MRVHAPLDGPPEVVEERNMPRRKRGKKTRVRARTLRFPRVPIRKETQGRQ
jgi:hypothetical protein